MVINTVGWSAEWSIRIIQNEDNPEEPKDNAPAKKIRKRLEVLIDVFAIKLMGP